MTGISSRKAFRFCFAPRSRLATFTDDVRCTTATVSKLVCLTLEVHSSHLIDFPAPRYQCSRDNQSMKTLLRALLPSIIAISLTCIECVAQSIGNLQLHLQADPARPAAPRTLSLLLINKTDHDVFAPPPLDNCEDGYNGWFKVFQDFTPLKGKPPEPRVEGGCDSDRGGPWPSILVRIKGSALIKEAGWKLLHSGEAIVIKTQIVAFKSDSRKGTYEFWARYVPPSILPSDENILAANKFDIPSSELQSNHVTILKK